MKAGPHHHSKHIHMSAMIVTDPMLPESLCFRNSVRRSTMECELHSALLQSRAVHGLHLSMDSQMYMQYPMPSLNSAWNLLLVFAAKDREGPDWNSAEAQDDQGIGVGVIIRRSKEKGKVMVRWPNGVRQVCRWSLSGPTEVEYCHPDGDTSNVLQSSSIGTEQALQPVTPDSRYRGEREAVRFEGDGVWQWRDADNTWRPYDRKTNKEIEAACKKKSGISCLIERDGKQRRVMFRKLVEKVIDEGTECEVRRIPDADA